MGFLRRSHELEQIFSYVTKCGLFPNYFSPYAFILVLFILIFLTLCCFSFPLVSTFLSPTILQFVPVASASQNSHLPIGSQASLLYICTISSRAAYSSTPKMERAAPSEMLISEYQTTRCHTPEDRTFDVKLFIFHQ
jgi:hypothetical protein